MELIQIRRFWYSMFQKCQECGNALNWISSEGKIPQICYFWNIKMPNLHIPAPKKSLGYCTLWNFWVRQKEITCDSLFCSPCTTYDNHPTHLILDSTAVSIFVDILVALTNTLRIACCPQQQNVHAGSQLANNTFERKRSVCVWTLRKNGKWRRGNKDSNSWFENTWKILNSARPKSVLRPSKMMWIWKRKKYFHSRFSEPN